MEAVEGSRRTCTPSLGPEEEGETLLPSGEGGRGAVLLGRAPGGRNIQRRLEGYKRNC